ARKYSPPTDAGARWGEPVDHRVIVIGRRRDAQPCGARGGGRIVDRLEIDTVLGEQEIARFLALLRITYHHWNNVRLTGHDRQACQTEHGLYARRAFLMAVALPLRRFEMPNRRGGCGTDSRRQRGGENESRRVRAHRIDDFGASRDVAAQTSERLRQRALDYVDAVRGPFPRGDAGATPAVHAGRMHL